MKLDFIEVGQIVNTHGVRGEVKVQPWCDEAEQFLDFKTLYLDGAAVKPKSVRIHKGSVLLTLPGVEDMDSALHLKTKVLSVRREDLALPEGRYLNAELMGLSVIDAETGAEIDLPRQQCAGRTGRKAVSHPCGSRRHCRHGSGCKYHDDPPAERNGHR